MTYRCRREYRLFQGPGNRDQLVDEAKGATHLLEPDPARLAVVRRAFELATERKTEREVAAATGLPLFTVRIALTSPLYVGRLRTGERAPLGPCGRARPRGGRQGSARHEADARRRPAVRRDSALTMLHCSDSGRHLIGDTGRCRHPDACEAFMSVRREPRKRLQGQRRNMPGTSYRADEYQAIVREVLAQVSLGAEHIAAVVGETREAEPDRLATARIERERDAALARYRRDRDLRTLERNDGRPR